MIRAVLDTNVLVSGLISPYGPSRHIFTTWQEGRFELVTSLPCLEELDRVLHYSRIQSKYQLAEDDIFAYILLISTPGDVVPVPQVSNRICDDAGDDKFIVAAIAAEAQFVVSGDSDLLSMNGFAGIEIVTPRDFAIDVLGGWQPMLPGIE